MHTFTFLYTAPCGQVTLDLASWEVLHLEPELEELRVRISQRVYDIVVGSGFLGKFVYLPDRGLGFPANDLSDATFSNDHLIGPLDCEDAAAVASALRDYVSC